jgi:CTP:molybdopterin cytidylyltransferase MocA
MPNIGAVILAAGESSRLGQPKQLVQFRGKSLVRRVVEAADKAGCSLIVVVTGGDAEDTEKSPHLPPTHSYSAAGHPLPSVSGEAKARGRHKLTESIVRQLKQTPATIVTNENWRRGIGGSIRAGVQALIDHVEEVENKEGRFLSEPDALPSRRPKRASAVRKLIRARPRRSAEFPSANAVHPAACQHAVLPLLDAIVLLTCDQPFVDANVIKQLIRLREQTGKAIVASSYSNTLGVPALFDRSYFEELLSLGDASGAKSIILSDRDRAAEFPFPEGKIDIDTAEDYEKLVISE